METPTADRHLVNLPSGPVVSPNRRKCRTAGPPVASPRAGFGSAAATVGRELPNPPERSAVPYCRMRSVTAARVPVRTGRF